MYFILISLLFLSFSFKCMNKLIQSSFDYIANIIVEKDVYSLHQPSYQSISLRDKLFQENLRIFNRILGADHTYV